MPSTSSPRLHPRRTVCSSRFLHSFIHGTSCQGKNIHWLLTHLDTADVEESWSYPGDLKDAFEVVKDWDPVVAAGTATKLVSAIIAYSSLERLVISTTPPGALLDWKLVYRDGLPRWASEGGRIAV
jgi:hypothetical protein